MGWRLFRTFLLHMSRDVWLCIVIWAVVWKEHMTLISPVPVCHISSATRLWRASSNTDTHTYGACCMLHTQRISICRGFKYSAPAAFSVWLWSATDSTLSLSSLNFKTSSQEKPGPRKLLGYRDDLRSPCCPLPHEIKREADRKNNHTPPKCESPSLLSLLQMSAW